MQSKIQEPLFQVLSCIGAAHVVCPIVPAMYVTPPYSIVVAHCQSCSNMLQQHHTDRYMLQDYQDPKEQVDHEWEVAVQSSSSGLI